MSTGAFKSKDTRHPTAYSRALIRVGKMANWEIRDGLDEMALTQKGIDPVALDALIGSIISQEDLNWVVEYRSWIRRKEKGERLTPDESGRWLRAAKIIVLAEEVFGDTEKASRWLRNPRRAFNNQNAIQIMRTESGAALIEEKLNQIDSGYFS